ncbi:MAG: 1-acyl-sn-glycerol-3-phosphate acyltransferase [Deltaproteobacteria bacterium]|nr:1-acyl-sn-glycerol-3-phosphate acyltransferase [Deltaproteobacteria bacterium]MBI3294550.1 1-acyl-sn-glycerol-3-phosphate acyltransferase [Deltaproteobacteria bacterium]
MTPEEIAALAPYDDSNVRLALGRCLGHPATRLIHRAYFPELSWEAFQHVAISASTIFEFQRDFIDVILRRLELATTTGITLTGREEAPDDRCHLYISNHRDIILDSALFTDILFRRGYRTPEICLGDNLLRDPFVTDLVKLNKGITVKRNLPAKELFLWSRVLSRQIRSCILQGRDSVWIAQAEGRSKDGSDRTHPGVLKMLALSGEGDLLEKLRPLHIVPVAVSYEFDPSDVEKSREIVLGKTGPYKKRPTEDFEAMARAFQEFKGGVAIVVGEEIDTILDEAQQIALKSDQVRFVAQRIDECIHRQYHNFSSNFIATDQLTQQTTHSSQYTPSQKERFFTRLEERLDANSLSGPERESVRQQTLALYAASVRPEFANTEN